MDTVLAHATLPATQQGVEVGEQLLTADDLAKLLKVSKHQVLRWYHGNGLPGRTLSPKCVRFRWQEVLDWIDRREETLRSA